MTAIFTKFLTNTVLAQDENGNDVYDAVVVMPSGNEYYGEHYKIDEVLSIGQIENLENVNVTSVQNNHFLSYDSASLKWINKQPSDALLSLGITSTAVELNYLDITTLGTSEASKAITANASGDITIPDSDKLQFGAGSDMTLYHNGTDSYLTNQTGALKIATETSGVAITLGHSTSEVTVSDNLNVTGDLTVDTSVLKIDSTNNRVGIGTASPAKVLHAVDTTSNAEIARFEGADGNIGIQSGSKVTFSNNGSNSLTCTDAAGSLTFETGGSGNNRLTISNTGVSTFTNNVVIDNAKLLRLSELDSNGSNTVSIKAPDAVTSDITLVLPDGTGTNGQALTTDGSGNLSWTAVSGFKTYSSKTSTFSAAVNNHYSVNTTSGATVVSLPQISTTTAGESIVVKFKAGTNTLTLTPYSGNTIEGLANLIMTDSQSPGQSITLVSDGTSSWEII